MYIKATIAISYLAVTTSTYMCTQCAFYRENYMMADSDVDMITNLWRDHHKTF